MPIFKFQCPNCKKEEKHLTKIDECSPICSECSKKELEIIRMEKQISFSKQSIFKVQW